MKKNMNQFVLLAVLLANAGSLMAHEGHVHEVPGNYQAKNIGAKLGANEELVIEVTYSNATFKIFPFDLTQKPIDPSKVKLSAQVELPRKKAEKVTVQTQKDHFSIPFDSKGTHRVTLILKIEDEHGDVLKFTFEPKR